MAPDNTEKITGGTLVPRRTALFGVLFLCAQICRLIFEEMENQ